MRTTVFIYFTWLCVIFALVNAESFEKLRYCVAKNSHKRKHEIQLSDLNRNNDSIEYIVVNERSNCLRKLIAGKADFAVFEPEDLVANYLNSNLDSPILITHDLRTSKSAKTRFEMVALVSADIRSFGDLEGRSFCHPGFDSDVADWSLVFANYFQTWILPPQCDADKTLIENKISSLSSYFGSACIAGPWSFNQKEDFELKTKYRNLCALCDNPSSCHSGDKYHGREGALLCLTDNIGDIAWVRLDDAIAHFEIEKIDNSRYNYLCPDGTFRPMSSGNPCFWITKPWPVIAARRQIAEKVSKKMESLSSQKESWRNNFLNQLENYYVVPLNTDTLIVPSDYLSQFNEFASAFSRTTCSPRSIKWCVASNLENHKCQWIRDLASAHGIEPTINCHQYSSRENCIEAIKNGACDFFVIKPDEMMEAFEKNLTTLLQLAPKNLNDLNTYGIVVKNNSKIFDIRFLAKTRACFTKERSIEWNAFVTMMANRSRNPAWCAGVNDVHGFFHSIILNELKANDNLNYLNYDNENVKYVNHMNDDLIATNETYNCVISGNGDVAFVNLNNVKDDSYRSEHNLRTICVDPKRDECYLTWSSLGAIVVNLKLTNLRRNEIHGMLMQLNVWFGSKVVGQAPAISLFGPFDSLQNIIFPEKTHSFEENMDYVKMSRNYLDVIKELKNRESRPQYYCSIAHNIHAINILILLMISLSLSYCKFL